MKVIFHIDMNSYFATVEQQANPHLRGKPVGVCEHLGGIIIAASIEAKRIGIKTGTPTWEARKIYPNIVLLPVDPPKIRFVTERLWQIFGHYTDAVERYSIDEAFLDVTHLIGRKESQELEWSDALLLALEIKQRIRREIGEWLSCSVGISYNKLLAKIGSDMQKPDGLTLLRPQDIGQLYERLFLTDIPGIGVRLERRLNALGIQTIRQLADFPVGTLRAHFGLPGYYLHELGNFRGSPDLVRPEEETFKSMGHSCTLPRVIISEREQKELLFKLSEKVARRMRAKNFIGRVISCYARFVVTADKDFNLANQSILNKSQTSPDLWSPSPIWERGGERLRATQQSSSFSFGKSHKISEYTNDGRVIFAASWKLFSSFSPFNISLASSPPRRIEEPREGKRPPSKIGVKMMGVTVSGLVSDSQPEPLFERYKKPRMALSAMDKVNDKYGDFTLRRGLLLRAKDFAGDTVGFGRMKELKIVRSL